MFKSSGQLKYFHEHQKLILLIDHNISHYYFSLIPKYLYPKKQKYEPHISIIRNELVYNFDYLFGINNFIFNFYYDNFIYNNNTYFWLHVESEDLTYIRLNAGLSKYSYITKSPDGKHNFHITLANVK